MFAGYDEKKNSYKGWISQDGDPWTMSLDDTSSIDTSSLDKPSLSQNKNGELIWSNENATAEKAYPVTVYWIWPELLESYLRNAASYTGTRPLLFPAEPEQNNEGTTVNSLEALPSKLFEKMCKAPSDESSLVKSNRYLRWETAAVFKDNVTKETLEQIRAHYNSVLYGNVAAYYDLADQYIGSNVQYVKLTLNAK